ncbi:MAG: DUF5004 domain-containing protein [Schleiferiaceae bacterium]|nr:DUF5004 domain-containing protein [Schleiferiaceae bacterium]
MKTIIKSSLFALLIAFSVVSCKPEIKEIGEFHEIIDGFPGTWRMGQVTLTDLLLPVPETQDASALFQKSSTSWILQFEEDGTYSVTEKGPGPDFFGTSGTWALSPREDFPTHLVLDDGSGNSTTFRLGNMPRAIDNSLQLRYTRNSCGQDYIRYNFTFNRQ